MSSKSLLHENTQQLKGNPYLIDRERSYNKYINKHTHITYIQTRQINEYDLPITEAQGR
jgi:hypothetical protein